MQNFHFNEALKRIQAGKPITGSDGVLAPLIKQLTQAALNAEIQSHLEQSSTGNRRNGYSKKDHQISGEQLRAWNLTRS